MHSDSETSMKHFTRGGQTMLHNFRMVNQIINRVLIFCLIIFTITTVLLSYLMTTPYQRYVLQQFGKAELLIFFRNKEIRQPFILPDGQMLSVASQNLIESRILRETKKEVANAVIKAIIFGGIITLITFSMVFYFLKRRGKKQTETKQLRGDTLANLQTVKKMIIKSKKVSDLSLANLPLPKDFECRHVLIHGTTGSGKSVCIREFLDQIRARGDKAIIYDKGCDYVSSYYRAGTDILLNPMDERTTPWHLWDECRDDADYDSLAAALMPMPPGTDPFWINAARTVFSTAAKKMQSNPDRSVDLLLQILLTMSLSNLGVFLKGTEAETLVSEKSEKTALSIKSVLTTYAKSLQYVVDKQNSFSIRKWIQDENQKNWLFISSISDRHESLKPLISMWLDIAANALMSLTPSSTRRIWMIFDELPSLQRLPYLPEAFAEARKFGGCLVAGMQSIAQLRKIYGNHAAEEISNLCNTRIFFRDPSFETAQWASKELGENEIEEMKENVSYSESAMRSGISITNQRFKQQIISPSEVMHLNDLEAFIRLPGNLPVTKMTLKYKEYLKIAMPFIYNQQDKK